MDASLIGTQFWPVTTEGSILAFLHSMYGLAMRGYTIADYGSAGLNDDLGVTGISVNDSKVAAGLSWTF